MEKKMVFGNWEVATILINAICTKIFINFPRTAAEYGGSASWIFTIYISLLAFVGFWIILRLYKDMEGKDIIDVGEYVGKDIGRIIVGCIIMVFLIYVTSVYMRTFSESIKLIALTNSPISFVEMFFLVCMIGGAYFGLESIGRLHGILVPLIATGFMLIIIMVSNNIEILQVFPLLGNGIEKIFVSGALKVSVFSEILLLFLLVPFIKNNKNLKKSGYVALGFSSAFLLISSFVYITVFPMPVALERVIPIFQMARLITIGRFFQRIESVFMIAWVAASLLFVTLNFYFIVYAFKKTFKLEYYKPLIFPFAILLMNISLFPPNLLSAVKLETEYFRNWAWIITFVMPIILLWLARIKIGKGNKNTA